MNVSIEPVAGFRRNPQHRPEQPPAFFAESHFTPSATPQSLSSSDPAFSYSSCHGVDRVLIDFKL